MPPEDGDPNVESLVDSFLADEGNDSDADDDAPAAAAEATETDDADAAKDPDASDDAGADPAAEGDEPKDKDKPAEREPTALEKAIEAGDVRKFLEALGDKAEALLGGKAHKALRLQAAELGTQEKRLKKAHAALNEKFGDPVEARKKWEAGDIDAFVDLIEKQSGVPWADCEKAVHESIAGRETRLQSKAKADEAAKAVAETKRAEHETSLKTLITDTVKASDAKLLAADPEIVEDVFRIMRTGWKRGINTPAKALAELKKRLVAAAAVLAPAAEPAGKSGRRTPPQIRQPRTPQSRGEPPKDVDDMVDQFLREEGYHGR